MPSMVVECAASPRSCSVGVTNPACDTSRVILAGTTLTMTILYSLLPNHIAHSVLMRAPIPDRRPGQGLLAGSAVSRLLAGQI